ncbi:MAG: hypothetical protein DIZ80_09295 [endosymbiont of Galathealinum brachiosum]|uniref:Uncharacterized protein n=1 Tax=endosymbiont of Galathealinum brachiosum TaxID=2200906 RepID=A0A370DC61_9GAMM|nr:MAG: hypothetical protein DIZ80_09295 [endosymbiont of Galathealinum brachiosum]
MSSIDNLEIDRSKYKNAFMAIDYRPDAKDAYKSIDDLAISYKINFLELLERDPKGPVEDFVFSIRDEYNAWLNPYKSLQLNSVLQEVRKLGNDAEKEYKKIIDVLGESVDASEVFSKIKTKYTISNESKAESSPDKNGSSIQKLMSKYSVTLEEGKYKFEEYKYENLIDAINYITTNVFKYKNNKKYIPIDIHSFISGLHTERIIDLIKEGKYDGQIFGNEWYIFYENIKSKEARIYDSSAAPQDDPGSDSHEPVRDKRSYLTRLFEGDISLVVTYWIWGVLIVGLSSRIALLIYNENFMVIALNENSEMYTNIFNGILFGASAFMLVSIWRSAGNYTGNPTWKILARTVVVINTLVLLGNFSSTYNISGSSTYGLEEEIRLMNKGLPMMLDSDTRMDNVSLVDKNYLYKYTLVNATNKSLDKKRFKKIMFDSLKETVCSEKSLVSLLNQDYKFIYRYKDKNNSLVMDIILSKKYCL